jgi:hypothetical protein
MGKLKPIKVKQWTKRELSMFENGKRTGRKEIIDKLIVLLELDERYERIKEDY